MCRGFGRLSLLCGLVGCLAGTVVGQSLQGEVSSCPGDVNLDGERSSADLTLLSAHLSGSEPLQGEALGNADANLDLVVDVGDLSRLVQHTTGRQPLLPCGEFAPATVSCPLVVPQAASALPLQTLGIGTLPQDFAETVAAIVVTESQKFSVVTSVERQEDGLATLFVPFHPGVSTQGGPVTIQVTDGWVTCDPFNFSIEGLPAAPGEFDRVVDAVQEVIDFAAETVNLTRQDLLDPQAELPQVAVPLVLAQRVLDNPDDPGSSLRALSGGTYLGAEIDTAFLDAAVAHLGVRGLVGQGLASASALAQRRQVRAGETGQGRHTPLQIDVAQCASSAQALSECMMTAASVGEALLEFDGTATDKIGTTINSGLTVAGHGQDDDAVRHQVDRVTSALGIGFTAEVTRWAYLSLAYLLPSRFTRLDLNLMPAVLDEDLDEGTFETRVEAMSRGWKLDARRVQDFSQTRPSTLVKGLAESGLLPKNASGSRTTEAREVKEKLLKAIEMLGELGPDGIIEIEPMAFPPVLLPGTDWKKADFLDDSVELIEEGKNDSYKPVKVGKDRLEVQVGTDGQFGGATISTIKPVEVKAIEVNISPREATAEAGEMKNFTVTVENSAHPDEIEVMSVHGVSSSTYDGGKTHTVTYVAPDLPCLTDVITARHTATTGARENSNEVRQGQARVELTQEAGCDCFWVLKLGESTLFSLPGDRSSFIHAEGAVLLQFTTEGRGSLQATHIPTQQFWGVSGGLGLGDPAATPAAYSGDSEETGLTGALSQNNESGVAGYFDGSVDLLEDADAEPVATPFRIDFRVTADPLFGGIFPGCEVE